LGFKLFSKNNETINTQELYSIDMNYGNAMDLGDNRRDQGTLTTSPRIEHSESSQEHKPTKVGFFYF